MMLSTEDFLVAFHSLQGTSIGERRKNLFALLPRIDATIDFSSIHPKTPLEECFKVQLLLHFKKVSELLQIIQSENPILIHRVLKEPWFVDYLSEPDLVEALFPHISFNAKVKVLNKLGMRINDCEKGDRLFFVVQARYGNYLASKVLPGCSARLISHCIQSWKIELGARQVLVIIRKHPDLLPTFMEKVIRFSTENCKYQLWDRYRAVLVYALQSNLPGFLQLVTRYQMRARVGWRITDRVIVRDKRNVIQHANVLREHLHRKQTLKRLGKDFDEYYLKLLPRSVEQMKYSLNEYIGLLPDGRLELLLSSFRKAYGTELLQHPECIVPKLMELMSIDDREAWMNSNPKPTHLSEDTWDCLWKIPKSLPLIKAKIGQTVDVKRRGELIGCLVETCRINGDSAALLEVCKFVLAEYRNDNPSILYSFMRCLMSCFKPVEFDSKTWKVVNELVRLFIAKKLLPFYYHDWLYAYLNYLIVNDVDAKEYIKEISEKTHLDVSMYTYMETEDAKRICLEKYGEFVSNLYDNGVQGVDLGRRIRYYETVLEWNQKHPKKQIEICYKSLIKMVGDLDQSNKYWGNMALSKVMCLKISDIDMQSCLDALIGQDTVFVEMNVFLRLIKHKPLMILNNLDRIIKSIVTTWYTCVTPFFWMSSRNYTHLDIPQKIIANCLETIKVEDGNLSNKRNCATALACLMSPNEFLKTIEPYYPTDLKMEVDDEANQETYLLQQAITASLKCVIPPSVVLDAVLKFSKGDYLKFIQRALHSVSHGTNEDNLPRLYDALVDRPVSVRKNVVYLTYKVLDRSRVKVMSQQFEAEKNPSINKFLLKAALRYFLKNPSDSSWASVRLNLERVDANDEEIVTILTQTIGIPPDYLPRYLICVLEYLENLAPKSKKSGEAKTALLASIESSIIPNLSDEFFWPMIKKGLFQEGDNKMASFASRFVAYGSAERVDVIFGLVKEYATSKCVTDFILSFIQLYINDKSVPKCALQKFVQLWNDFVQPHEAFEEFLHLELTLIYLDQERIVEAICELCKRLEYDNVLIMRFGSLLDTFVPRLCKEKCTSPEVKRLDLISRIIETETIPCLLVAISLLPEELTHPRLTKLPYERIMKRLAKFDDESVRFALALYFNKLGAKRPFAEGKNSGDSEYCNYRIGYITEFTNEYRMALIE